MVAVVLSSANILNSGLTMYRPLFGQIVNVGFGPAGVLGLLIAGAGAGLYFMRSMRPELARDHDIFFAAIGLLCGGILFFQGWRLDPILLFGQMLLSGTAVFFASESIRLRGIATDQARRNTPIVDDDRPVGRVYRAELDELAPSEDMPPVPRIRSAREGASGSGYGDRLAGETRSSRRSRGRRSNGSYKARADREGGRSQRRRSPRLNDDRGGSSMEPPGGFYDDRSSRRRPRPTAGHSDDMSSRPPRRRSSRTRTSSNPAVNDDYVDYRPIDYNDPGQRFDNSSDYDDEWS